MLQQVILRRGTNYKVMGLINLCDQKYTLNFIKISLKTVNYKHKPTEVKVPIILLPSIFLTVTDYKCYKYEYKFFTIQP